MADRYVAIPRAAYVRESYQNTMVTSDIVHEQDKSPIDTGLFDARGVKLFRLSPAIPLGFMIPAKTE